MKRKYIIITIVIAVLVLLITVPNSNAALQSNGNAGTTKKLNDWIINIRQMEALGGGMGLTESIQANLTPTTPSNNLDVHMEKNSEYGAMAILSASSYGNPNKIASGGTTTGNKTGIVINLNRELVAAGNNSTGGDNFLVSVPNIQNAANKYKQIYTYGSSGSGFLGPIWNGDAISETNGWHGATSKWYTGGYAADYNYTSAIVRAYAGSIFSYFANRHIGNSEAYDDTHFNKPLYSRAAMVCGEGI